MSRSTAEIVREYGPFPDADQVNGVTYDGHNVWFGAGDKIVAFDPASGTTLRSIDVAAHAGTSFDGQHLFQLAEDRIQKIDPETGRVLATIPAPGDGKDSGLTWAEGTLWVGQYRDRKIHQVDPETGAILRTIESNRFVTGVTWVDGELWHAHLGRRRQRTAPHRSADGKSWKASTCRQAWGSPGSSPMAAISFSAAADGAARSGPCAGPGARAEQSTSEDDLEQALEQLLQRDHRQHQRQHGQQRDDRQLEDSGQAERHIPHLLQHVEAVAQVRQRLDVGAANERLVWRRTAAQPFAIVFADVALRQRAVLAQAVALGGFELPLNTSSGPRTANTISATSPISSTLNSGSLAPA